MNYNYLLYFSTLAETEHYTTAAARLGISQPALSSAIHSLENSLGGVKLFEKAGRNIRLTEAGRFYQEEVDAAIHKLHEASLLLRESRTQAPVVIRLGVVSGVLAGLLADKIAEYARENPRIRFYLTESSSENLMDMLRQEKLDMAVTDCSDRDRSLHFMELFHREIYAALPAAHPLADRASIDPQEVVYEAHIAFNHGAVKSFMEWTTGNSREGTVVCTANTSRSALDLVSAGVGIAFIPADCAEERPGIAYVPVNKWRQALYMCFLYDRWLEPLVWNFTELAVKSFRGKKG